LSKTLSDQLKYERNSGNFSHTEEAILGYPGAFTWLKYRQAGIPPTTGCSTDPFSRDSLIALLQLTLGDGLLVALLALLGVPINILESEVS
jgi:hypothetical protein